MRVEDTNFKVRCTCMGLRLLVHQSPPTVVHGALYPRKSSIGRTKSTLGVVIVVIFVIVVVAPVVVFTR